MAFDTLKRVLGFPGDEYEEDYENESLYEDEDDFEEEEPSSFRRNRFNSRRTSDFSFREDAYTEEKRTVSPVQMVLVKGKKFADVERVAENLKQRRSVIINFDGIEDKGQAQRIIDYLSGTTFAMGGNIQRLSTDTFIFAVGQVDLVGRIVEMNEKEGYFSSARTAR